MANLKTIDAAFGQPVESKAMPGIVAMAATDKGVVYEGAFGTRELGKDAAIPSTPWWCGAPVLRPHGHRSLREVRDRGVPGDLTSEPAVTRAAPSARPAIRRQVSCQGATTGRRGWRRGPTRGVRPLVAQVARVALLREHAEGLLERHRALPGRERSRALPGSSPVRGTSPYST